MDSGGLRVVLDQATRFLGGGGDMTVWPSVAVAYLLRISGVDHMLHSETF